MSKRLTIADVAGVKLADSNNFPPPYEVTAALDHAFAQGSQGWGVTREIGVYLFLARELHWALEIAETADENRRMLKGAQLETGRLKKKIEQLTAEVEGLRDELADSNDAMLRRFDPSAADSTDLHTWISCKLAELARVSGRRENNSE